MTLHFIKVKQQNLVTFGNYSLTTSPWGITEYQQITTSNIINLIICYPFLTGSNDKKLSKGPSYIFKNRTQLPHNTLRETPYFNKFSQ